MLYRFIKHKSCITEILKISVKIKSNIAKTSNEHKLAAGFL